MTRGPALLVHWDGYVPGVTHRYRLAFVDNLPIEGSVAPDSDAWANLLDGSLDDGEFAAENPLILGAAPGEPVRPERLRPIAERAGFHGFRHGLDPDLIDPQGPVKTTYRHLTHHRRAVASNHWRLVRALLHLIGEDDFDLIAVRLPALRQLAPFTQHPGHLRHALSLANDVSARIATLVRASETALVAYPAIVPLARTPARLVGLDKRRRVVDPRVGGTWHATRPLDLPAASRGASTFAPLLARREAAGGG